MSFLTTENPIAGPARMPVLSEYTDFRHYLKDMYEYRRRIEDNPVRPYSYSTFSAAADIRSPNYLKLIIEGRRNLSEDMMGRFAKALRLDRNETEEFKALVRYGQATEPMERNHFLKELSDYRSRRDLPQAMERVPDWLGWVLWAMGDQKNVQFDVPRLVELLRTKAGPEDVRRSLEKLFERGDLNRDAETGEVTKGRDLIESPKDVPTALIRRLQAELIYLGVESLFRDSPKDREFGALTMAMTPEEFEQVRFELRQMRKRLQKDLTVKRMSGKADRVYQLNIQLFPVTDPST